MDQYVRLYTAHRLRAYVQFQAIIDVKEKLLLDETLVLLVVDHKQKILDKEYREGQQSYFGKRGHLNIGTCEVLGATHIINEEEVSGT